jgi:hypothetical protein
MICSAATKILSRRANSNGLQYRDEEQNEAHHAHNDGVKAHMRRVLRIPLCPRAFSGFSMNAGDDIESENHPGSDDASHPLASGSTDGRRLAVMFEAFKNMRISAYTAALMG